jgi:hypothetical protein
MMTGMQVETPQPLPRTTKHDNRHASKSNAILAPDYSPCSNRAAHVIWCMLCLHQTVFVHTSLHTEWQLSNDDDTVHNQASTGTSHTLSGSKQALALQ